ncbi:cupin domain-containing protein [Amycolatopsis panacis]|uniref:Cupin n=1 Tax=Amycolatopsis panacis TaxID=2340917 RepID=A0A419HZ69_9PSEU|nr:hypothetical protein [Amycolatopsis panacis]RJQ82469.1 hypothetical protein D5S19_21720 [Amycolatopsis panacis]
MSESTPDQKFPTAPGDELVFENDRVRVWSMTLAANGGIYDFHQHEHDHVILWPDAGRAEAMQYGDDDWTISQVAERGFTMFKTVGSGGPMVPHRIRNLEDHPVTHYIIELISEPSPSPVTLPTESNGRGHTTNPGMSVGS